MRLIFIRNITYYYLNRRNDSKDLLVLGSASPLVLPLLPLGVTEPDPIPESDPCPLGEACPLVWPFPFGVAPLVPLVALPLVAGASALMMLLFW